VPARQGNRLGVAGIFHLPVFFSMNPEIHTLRVLSVSGKGDHILSDGVQRYFAPARLFTKPLVGGTLVSVIVSSQRKGRLAEVKQIVFMPEHVSQETE
jgi:hypothetical protein